MLDREVVQRTVEAPHAVFHRHQPVAEIHRLPRILEEHLYQAMDDLRCELIVDKGPNARHYTLNIEPFTLIGATTRVGMITAPLRDRFGVVFRLDYYDPEDLRKIVLRTAGLLSIGVSDDGASEIARRSRGTPRIANRLFRRVRDFAQVDGDGEINLSICRYALDKLNVDELGLDYTDHQYLLGIIERYEGGPVGVEALAASIGEEATTLEDVYEPFLLQKGFIKRTARGRVVTEKAYRHLKIKMKDKLL